MIKKLKFLALALIAMLGIAACDRGNGNEDAVADIEQGAYEGRTDLTEFTIPDGVVHIGNRAFYGCTNLKSITIPASVRWIGSNAFNGSLKEVHYNGDLASWCGISFASTPLPVFSAYALYINGEWLTSVTIPDSVTSIGGSAFYGCTSLTDVTIPNSVTSVGGSAFYNCTSLTSVTIPDSVTSIGVSAFSYCSSLTSVTIRKSVTSIGSSAFSGCTSLTSVTIPDSVTSIGGWAFSGCTSLAGVTIPDSVTSIGNYAFIKCTSLTSVKFTNTNGWSYYTDYTHKSTVAIDASEMTDASTNATNLKNGKWGYGLIRNP